MNDAYHGGRPVFTRVEGAIMINTSLVTPVPNHLPQNYGNQVVIGSYKQPDNATVAAYPASTYPTYPTDAGYGTVQQAQPVGIQPYIVTAQPVQEKPQRIAFVSVPVGAVPGQIITCASPTGEMLQVNFFS
jgi:hypothetical protein